MFRIEIRGGVGLKRVIAIILLTVVLGTSCSYLQDKYAPTTEFPTKEICVNQYNINCYFDEVEKLLKGYEHLTYYNNGETILGDIYIHLYPNAFENINEAPFAPSEHKDAYPLGFDTGFLNVDSVRVDGEQGSWEYKDTGRQVMRIKLPRPIEPGDYIDIDINFTVKFPRCYGRFGYGEKTIKAANWYPIAAVFDHRGWNLDPYHSIGDPFYSDMGDYQIRLVLPQSYTVAATGDIIKNRKHDSGNREWTIKAEKVRDFVWIASEDFKVSSKKTDGITVKSYHFDSETGEKALEVAVHALKVFNESFGKYPYKNYSVVAADFFIGGMEYPNLVLIGKELYNIERLFTLEYIIAHETAHQWWYGMVGSNPSREAWLDEGLTEYSTILYFEKRYGDDTAQGLLDNLIRKRYDSYLAGNNHRHLKIYGDLTEHSHPEDYHAIVYCGGALIFHNLREILGDEDFFKVLEIYFRNYAFENATTEDFIRIVEDVSRVSLGDQIRQWLTLGV